MEWLSFFEAPAFDHVQWPAMAVTVVAGWLVASRKRRRRLPGFGLFLLSNLLWVVWGLHSGAWALLALQGFLAVTNVRGLLKNEPDTEAPKGEAPEGEASAA